MNKSPSLFEQITLRYDNGDGSGLQEYVIPPEKVFGAIAVVEEHVTLKELTNAVSRMGQVSLTRLALAYSSVLRYAGAKNVTHEQVYSNMFSQDTGQNVLAAVNGLLGLMIPPSAIEAAAKKVEEETGKPGEPSPQPETPAAS